MTGTGGLTITGTGGCFFDTSVSSDTWTPSAATVSYTVTASSNSTLRVDPYELAAGWRHTHELWYRRQLYSAAVSEHFAREQAETEKRRTEAKARARQLLLEHLTPRQRADFEARGHFHVTTRRKHKYRITSRFAMGIIRLNARGKPMRAYCVSVMHGQVPIEDAMLAHKLMLETDEDNFVRVANHGRVRPNRNTFYLDQRNGHYTVNWTPVAA